MVVVWETVSVCTVDLLKWGTLGGSSSSSSSDGNGFKLTSKGPGSTRDVFKGSAPCPEVDGSGINYKRRKDIEVFKEKCIESTIIEIIAKDGKEIIVGSMYQPLNTDPIDFRNATNMISSNSLKEKKEIILGMDHNLDLLKSGIHKQTQLFLNDLLEKIYIQQ